jgi:hypothetical protein
MKRTRAVTILVLLVVCCAGGWAVGADFYATWTDLLQGFKDPNTGLTVFPTLLIPLGGLSEGMGTASAAVAKDAGSIEYNPAGSSILRDSELSFYHHNWIADSNLEGVVYTVRFDDLGIGVGGKFLYLPFTAYNEWGAAGAKDYISETVGTLNVAYNFLSNYSFAGLAVGSNFKIAYRNIPPVFALNQSSLALMADLGLQTSFNLLKFYSAQARNFSVGIVVKNLGMTTLAGETLPQMATAGIAWSPLRPWIIAVDFTYPFSFAGQPPAEVWNLAVGTTVSMTDFLSVQAGILWKADNPRISLGTAISLGAVDLTINYNLDLSGQLNPVDKFSVQARLNLGDSGRAGRALEVDDLYLQGATAFANGDYSGAIALWEKVLALDPGYVPASESIAETKRSMALEELIKNRGAQ